MDLDPAVEVMVAPGRGRGATEDRIADVLDKHVLHGPVLINGSSIGLELEGHSSMPLY
jgi:hypothetical protein